MDVSKYAALFLAETRADVLRAPGAAVRGFTVEVASQPAPASWRTVDVHRFAGDRFELGDLPTKRVSKIDAFAIRQRVATDQFGEIRERRKQPVVIEVPDLKITFAEVDLPKWQEWFEDFVIKGNSGQENEKSGAIAFLDAALAKELGSIELQNVGIYRLAPEPATAGAEAVRRWTAELYVERMAITLS